MVEQITPMLHGFPPKRFFFLVWLRRLKIAVSVTVVREQAFLDQTGWLRIGTLRKRHSKCVKRISKGKMPSKEKSCQNILKIIWQGKSGWLRAGTCVRSLNRM